ncbi:MAG: hypothetical protein HRT74_13245 [Flavobacteriales bacterium]|nr:hypothetical protein [Flavobacteriales bacterium]
MNQRYDKAHSEKIYSEGSGKDYHYRGSVKITYDEWKSIMGDIQSIHAIELDYLPVKKTTKTLDDLSNSLMNLVK